MIKTSQSRQSIFAYRSKRTAVFCTGLLLILLPRITKNMYNHKRRKKPAIIPPNIVMPTLLSASMLTSVLVGDGIALVVVLDSEGDGSHGQ